MSTLLVIAQSLPPETESYVITLLLWIGTGIIVPLVAAVIFLIRYLIKRHSAEIAAQEEMHAELLAVIKSNTESNVYLKTAVDQNTKATDRLTQTLGK